MTVSPFVLQAKGNRVVCCMHPDAAGICCRVNNLADYREMNYKVRCCCLVLRVTVYIFPPLAVNSLQHPLILKVHRDAPRKRCCVQAHAYRAQVFAMVNGKPFV